MARNPSLTGRRAVSRTCGARKLNAFVENRQKFSNAPNVGSMEHSLDRNCAPHRLAPVRATWALLALALVVQVFVLARPQAALAACANPVACENQLPGDPPSDWEVQGAGDPSIQGFATSMSVDAGQTEQFKINTTSTSYHIDILRLGYYGGDGARKIASNIRPTATLPQTQPACKTDSTNGLIDCGNWGVSASWTVPSTAVSGVYIAHLVRDDSKDPGGDSQIPFVVRNDSSHSDMVVATSDATWEAYNDYGGNSLYTCSVACPPGNPQGYKAAYAVSYNRPFDGSLVTDGGASYLYYAEYQMISFLERNGYDVSYVADPDLDQNPGLLLNHKAFISSGHDEYWSANERAGVQNAVNHGVNAAFFSANEIFWKTRWAASEDGSNTPYRTLVTYKETHFNAPTDPMDPPVWTGAWDDPRFSPPADGGQPSNSLTGTEFVVNSGSSDITVPAQYAKLGIWKNTAVSRLTAGQSLTLAPGNDALGYEWDVDADNGFRPPGTFDLSSTTVSGVQPFLDYGTTTGTGTVTHNMTLYKAPSGARVFGSGTVQWAWGLDDTNAWLSAGPPSGSQPDPNMQQMTVNMFALMGVQPTTLMSGLLAGAASADNTPPASTISSPANNANLSDGSSVTITGTATDSGGGVVAGVEISTDGGSSWHPAKLTTADGTIVSWSYTWVANVSPSTTIETRAVDDSGNVETPSDAISVNVGCPCSLWGATTPPSADIDSGDPGSIEVGTKFTSDSFGQISGIRFYKASTNTGTHVVSLWTTGGTLLASASATGESPSGWQTANFSSPVTIMPNTTYVAAYLAPSGHYSATSNYFYPAPAPTPATRAIQDSPPLHIVPNNTSVNGLYSYSATSTFPANSYSASNYWVDVSFTPIPPPGQVTGVSATAGFNSANVTWTAPSSGGTPTSYTVTPYIGSTAQTPTVVNAPATGTTITNLTQGTAYTFKVTASNPNGNGPASAASNSVTPTGPTAPAAPTGVSASPATGQAQVSWTTPQNNGSAITAYTITPFIGSNPQTPVQVLNGSATSATVTGLQNNTAYTFTVSATNILGTGAASVASSAVTPQNTILDFATPGAVDSGDTSSVEIGVKFTASTSGTVTGLRFYKAANNNGTHVGGLWSSSGTLLASATFTNETASGWQYMLFSNPVPINAGATYTAGYLAPTGHYSATNGGLRNAIVNPPLTAIDSGTSPNGVYAYSATSTMPVNSYNSTNYLVDVLFAPTPPGQPTNVTATAGNLSATVNWSAPATGGVASYKITPYIGTTAQTPTTVSGTPAPTTATVTGLTQGTSYTFTVQASNSLGSGPVSAPSNAVTPTAPSAPSAPTGVTASPASNQTQVSWTAPASNGSAITGYTVTPFIGTTAQTPVQVGASTTSATITGLTNGTAYTFSVTATNGIGTGPASSATGALKPADTIFDFATPTTADSGDTSPIEVGVKFTADSNGTVTGLRFYKATTNTGTHIGSLWSSTGTLLASATFSNESASGWQYVTFASPVSVTAGTTYVAGYFAPGGHYAVNSRGLNAAVDNPPLHSVANTSSVNGLYAYSSTSTFPTSSYQASNYWVDVLFQPPAPTAPSAPGNVSATPATNQAQVSWTAPAANGSAITGYTVTPFIGTTAQTPVQVGASATSATITGLTNGTAYTFSVTATNGIGTSPTATTGAVTPQNTIFDFATPTSVDSGDTTAVEVGVKFTATVNGSITGLRFYKASTNTGTHVANLWDASGNLLTTANYSNESVSGWQSVTFTTPVPVTAGTTYVASTFDPKGHYSVNSNAFSSPFSNPPLQTIANSVSPNGVYSYSAASTFPTSSISATNYWVDVLFATS